MDLATSPRPKFRTDLVAEVMEAEGQRFIDVIDPDTGDAFRFYEVEYSIACAMDGERDVRGLLQWAKEELGIEPSPAELQSVIQTLGSLGYLDTVGDVALQPGVVAPARQEYRGERAPDVELGQVARQPSESRPPDVRSPDGSRGSGADVELGVAGGKPTARMEDLGADDVELGLPGAPIEPMPTLRRATRPEDEDEGPTHLPAARAADFDDEVSVDLSEHLSIRPSDVKEAVRMSRSMKAVEVPPEVLDEIGQQEADAAARVAAAKAAAQSAHELEAEEPTPPPAEVPSLPRLSAEAKEATAPRAPVELPEKPVVVSRQKPEKTADKKEKAAEPAHAKPLPSEQPGSGGVSTLLIVLLVLAILGGGAFFVWKYVIDKPSADESSAPAPVETEPGTHAGRGTAAGPGTAAGTAAKPEPAGPPTATLALQGTPPVEVKSGKGGVVAIVAAAGSEVQAGDLIVEYQGVATLKRKVGDDASGLTYDVQTRYPREIEAATKKRDAALAADNKALAKQHEARIKERTARLAGQQQALDDLHAKIAALTVTAPVAGTVVEPVKKGARIGADAVVATIDTGQSLVAVFEVPEKAPEVDASVMIAAKDAPDQKANCTVTAVEGTKVTVTCPADVDIAADTVVVLEI